MKRPVVLLISEGDPGYDILLAGAKRAAARATRSGDIRLRFIENADHTFSQQAARGRLLGELRDWLSPAGPPGVSGSRKD
jgi:hypothetical protein